MAVKVKVTEDCISCGACVDVCPEVFYMGDDGFAHIREAAAADPALADKIRDASASCPTEAIPIEE
jgi:ferredoxin